MKIPFLVCLLLGLPECIAFSALVISLATGKLCWATILKIGIVQAVIVYIVRMAPFTPGVHIPILLTSQAIVVTVFSKIDIKKAIITSFLVFLFLFILEMSFNYIYYMFGLTSEIISGKIFLRIIVGYPQVTVLFILAFLAIKRGRGIRELLHRLSTN